MSEHSSTTATGEYDGGFFLRCPKALPRAIRMAAKDHMTSSAAYVRGAVLRQLQLDGHDPYSKEA
jgi:hypothetical protein